MYYIGDFLEDATVYVMFNTFTSDDPSASSTITNFINTDVHIHKDDGLTQRNNAAGITVSVDFDGITGSHMIKIDTSDNTVAGFWVTGSDYFVRIEGTTVDGATINAVVAHFSIQNRYMRGTDSAALASVCTAGRLGELDAANLPSDVDDIKTKTDNLPTDPADASVIAAAIAALPTDADVTTACTSSLNTYDAPTKAEMDTAHALLATVAKQDIIDGIVDTILTKVDTEIDAIVSAITALKDFDPDNDTVAHVTLVDTTTTNSDMVGTDNAALASVCTEARLAELDAANLPADIAAVPTTAEIKTAMETDGGMLDHLHEMTEDDVGVRRLTANALEEGPGGGTGLNAQETRDAMKLAPTVGDPAAGSIDEHLDLVHGMTEADGDDRRFTENALEEAPSGTGGDATAANQATIIGYTALAKKVLANKAVQNKSTGVITYYDDDGTTPILTITPTDNGSLITRTPS